MKQGSVLRAIGAQHGIRSGTAFRSAMVMAAAIAGIQSAFATDLSQQQVLLSRLGPYEGRGKGRARVHMGPGDGSRRMNRVAAKRRNVARNRLAHRA
jgi:hypothetical protein